MPERINGGQVLVVLGAVVLLVSLFLNWFEPSRSAWTVFEAWDLVLAAIAVAAIAAAIPIRLSGTSSEPAISERWLPALGIAALVIVFAALVNHPPAARGAGLEIGAWIALIAAVLLTAGAILSRARIALVITLRSADRTPAPPAPVTPSSPHDPPPEAETATQPLPPDDRP